jgi:hypothetical protein
MGLQYLITLWNCPVSGSKVLHNYHEIEKRIILNGEIGDAANNGAFLSESGFGSELYNISDLC